MEKHIRLSNTPTGWTAQFIGDAEIVKLFGTDTIPTAFTSRAEYSMVHTEIEKLNPGYIVS